MGSVKKRIKDGAHISNKKATQSGSDALHGLKGGQIKKIAAIARRFKKSKTKSGVTALFVGPPGAGKTQAARELAAEMGMNFSRVNLSAVVSKYIGETEKNLHRLFERARATEAVLLFDEADALFGKRSAAKKSGDRHTKMDADYLFEKLEEYGDPVILSSSNKDQVDKAFLNRIGFVVEFP